ncbi:MAG: thermonuclease family protein [Pyrinomonadaceae bacterium]
MNLHKRFFPAILLMIVLAFVAHAQQRFSGKVVDVIDGKTVVVQVYTGKTLTVVLQYIEIPEPEQELRAVVKDHLEKLILGQTVEVRPKGVSDEKTVGQIVFSGIDISQQMIRDGAAWHAILLSGGQEAGQQADYRTSEAQAKAEKRGVWSIEGMKTAWEFRAAKEEARKAAERAEWDAYREESRETQPSGPVRRQSAAEAPPLDMGFWANVSAADRMAEAEGLYSGETPEVNVGYITTSGNMLDLTGRGGRQTVESRTIYGYRPSGTEAGTNILVIGFLSESDDWQFEQSNSLVFSADRQQIAIGRPLRLYRQNGGKVQELLFFPVTRATLLKISAAKKLEFSLGKYSGRIDAGYQKLIKKLLDTTES